MPKLVIVRLEPEDNSIRNWGCINCWKFVAVFILAIVLLPIGSCGLYYYAHKYYDFMNPQQFQLVLHSSMMPLGLISINGLSIISYRVCRCLIRMNIKILHAGMHTATLGAILFGLYEIWEYHSSKNLDHLVSLHSLIGALAIALFGAQYLMGLMTFIGLLACENVTETARADFIPVHAAVGRIIFLLAVASCITGISQTMFTQDAKTRDDKLSLASTCGGAIILLGIVCMYILTTERLRYKAHIQSNIEE